ncbi:pyridoxamine 5'-phosphate oxidase family protein [Amycolatopsis sp. ATCC 39116]|uniref:pyridoxamine 5'-phosphate oxidase family protein n=1 Tax=Amycolatopsis sp. (strain ATCC 39116 / 75iv2) TaxID=385957 RepID=UPI000262827E|nr:pyridoxamine 5'-phosphate oxidase family protein [Amycolatopsis sp. ATCC 39116]
MANWREFEEQAPALAAAVRERLTAAETHVLATLRRDGSPRVSGTEVDLREPELYIGSMWGARKARDLQRDGRFALHAFPSGEGDAKLSGVAIEVTEKAVLDAIQGDMQPSHLFRLELQQAVLTTVEGDKLVATTWWPGREVVRFERT